MDNRTRYGIFIEPSGALRELIVEQKKIVEQILPGQTYCAHPPHSTLIFGCYHSPDNWLELLEDLQLKSFSVFGDGYHIFPNDVMAGGGHTLVHLLRTNPAMCEAQIKLAEVFEDFLDDPTPQHAFDVEPLKTSQQRFGFPFVGSHWIPHMTIASLKTSENHALFEELQAMNNRKWFGTTDLVVWQVEGDLHTEIARIDLVE